MKPLLAAALAGLIVASCASPGDGGSQIEADVEAACHIWEIAKDAAVIAGLFLPGVSAAAVVIAAFVDPVCDGLAPAAMSDPTTAAWITDATAKLRALLHEVAT